MSFFVRENERTKRTTLYTMLTFTRNADSFGLDAAAHVVRFSMYYSSSCGIQTGRGYRGG